MGILFPDLCIAAVSIYQCGEPVKLSAVADLINIILIFFRFLILSAFFAESVAALSEIMLPGYLPLRFCIGIGHTICARIHGSSFKDREPVLLLSIIQILIPELASICTPLIQLPGHFTGSELPLFFRQCRPVFSPSHAFLGRTGHIIICPKRSVIFIIPDDASCILAAGNLSCTVAVFHISAKSLDRAYNASYISISFYRSPVIRIPDISPAVFSADPSYITGSGYFPFISA